MKISETVRGQPEDLASPIFNRRLDAEKELRSKVCDLSWEVRGSITSLILIEFQEDPKSDLLLMAEDIVLRTSTVSKRGSGRFQKIPTPANTLFYARRKAAYRSYATILLLYSTQDIYSQTAIVFSFAA